jgi:hypothetical protein
MSVTNFPTTGGRRLGLRITSNGKAVTLLLTGHAPSGPVLFQLPFLVDNVKATSSGHVDQKTGTVRLSATTRRVTVQLKKAVSR